MDRREPPAARTNLIQLDASRGGHGAREAGRRLVALAKRFLAVLELEGCELSLVVVKDEAIRVLKRTWLGLDEATDVLSFPAGDAPGPGPRVLGDIVISLDTARRTALQLGLPLERELALYLAHGLLHLLGLDHRNRREAAHMAAEEARLLSHEGLLARAPSGRRRPTRRTSREAPDASSSSTEQVPRP